jgi:hypothetical protein
MNTDEKKRRRKNQCPSVCISGSKQTDLREEKALAGYDPIGHPGIHIQSVVSTPFAALTA